MAPIVNLRTARKQAKRRKAEQDATANRIAYGRPKTKQNLERALRDKERKGLDQHRIETGDGQ
jgi:hypothetical protein